MRVGSSWAYVCLPGDLASRQIAGHSVGVGHDADLVLAAFAALRFPLDEIEVFHTDRGGGFAGERVERVLDVFGVTRSLSRCFASMFVRQVRQCFSVVWADGFPRCRHRFPVM